MRTAVVACLALLALAAPARAGFIPGGVTPPACGGPGFVDAVGTAGTDLVPDYAVVPARIYGLTGDDLLAGSAVKPTCLFGGRGDDVLELGAAGGVAEGELGADDLLGSPGADGLSGGDGADVLIGAEGNDVLRGGRGVDGFHAGPGDDVVDSADGRPEFVDCGDGNDTALADGVDVLVGCEHGSTRGARLGVLRAPVRRGRAAVRFRVPHTDTYQVLAGGPCDGAMRVLATVTAHAGAHPAPVIDPGGCRGAYIGIVARAPACPAGRHCLLPRPVEPIALLTFRVP